MAEADGDVIATSDLRATCAGEAEPGRYWTLLHHQGADVHMPHDAIREPPETVRELWTYIREDFVPAAGFLEPERFEERFRSWGAHLDLSTFDPTRFAPLVPGGGARRHPARGYRDLAGGPARDRRLLNLQRTPEDDAPAFEPVIPRRHDDVASPDTILGATVVAVAWRRPGAKSGLRASSATGRDAPRLRLHGRRPPVPEPWHAPIADDRDVDHLDTSEDGNPTFTFQAPAAAVLYVDVLNNLPRSSTTRTDQH